MQHGHIEGSHPKKMTTRASGELSKDLTTHDIIGAQASTKGLGPFANKPRETFRNNVTTMDIIGAQVSTIKNGKKDMTLFINLGALSERRINPLEPQYDEPGATANLRQDHSYGEPWKEMPIKKTNTRLKPEWKRSTVIPIIEDKKTGGQTGAPSFDPLIAAATVRLLKNDFLRRV